MTGKIIIDPDRAVPPAFVLADSYRSAQGPWHSHKRAQLLHVSKGVVTVTTEIGQWVSPPQRGLWIPSGTRHSISSGRPFQLLTLYVDPGWGPVPQECRVVNINRLEEELLHAAATFGTIHPLDSAQERIIRVILDQLSSRDAAPLNLPTPRSAALRQIANSLMTCPSDRRSLKAWCSIAAITTRTAERRFISETGMTFGQWRQQLRLLCALERLGARQSVTQVALDVGYEDVSAFIAAFKDALGETPARYFRSRRSDRGTPSS